MKSSEVRKAGDRSNYYIFSQILDQHNGRKKRIYIYIKEQDWEASITKKFMYGISRYVLGLYLLLF